MANSPTISVVLPVYNTARYVAEAVESIVGQTCGDFELLIFDDGSTDGSVELLRKYAERDGRIQVFTEGHAGYVTWLNRGIELARGEFIGRMDSDDVALPQRLEKQLAYMREHPRCVMLGTAAALTDPDGHPYGELHPPEGHKEIDALLLEGKGWAMVHPTIVMRRDAVVKAGGYRKKYEYAEDLDLFLRMGERGELANLGEVLLHYRQHYRSVNRTRYTRQEEIMNQIMREAYSRRGLEWPEGFRFRRPIPLAVAEQSRAWGWRALQRGDVKAARRHAITALRAAPLRGMSWRLMLCALRGR